MYRFGAVYCPIVFPRVAFARSLCNGPVHDVGMIKNGCGFSCTGHDDFHFFAFEDAAFVLIEAFPTRGIMPRVAGDAPERDLAYR